MKCTTCGGTGFLPDDKETGDKFKFWRKEKAIGLREAARMLNISHTYLSQLERGERRWTSILIAEANEAIKNYAHPPVD